MPWRCRLAADREEVRCLRVAHGGRLPVGTMYHGDPSMVDGPHSGFYLQTFLSREYRRDWLKRRLPLFVALPNGLDFCVDSAYSDHRGTDQAGWTVTGEVPRLTVTPSINCTGTYHGYLTDGQITEDVEGRTFPDAVTAS